MKVIQDGLNYLGGAIGSKSFLTTVQLAQVHLWSEEIDRLVEITECEPHAAFAAFTHSISPTVGVNKKVTFHLR